MLDIDYLTREARRCRRLARGADDRTRLALTALAVEYEAKLVELAANEANK